MPKKLYVVNVEAAIFKDNKWLLAERSHKEDHAPGVFSIVGGKVEATENCQDVLEQTLKREIMEEVGLEVHNDMRYIKSSLFYADFGAWVLDIVFLCRYKSGEARALEPDELDSVAWMTLGEALAHEKVDEHTKASLKLAEQMRLGRLDQ